MPLIVLEGIDGSGTTLQSKQLYNWYRKYHKARWTCRPTSGPFGTLVRQVFEGRFPGVDELPNWRTMLHLFLADYEHSRSQLESWLKQGLWVISDRYWLSSMTYQVASATSEGVPQKEAADLVVRLCAHLPEPAATIILDVSVEEGLRRKNKEPDHYEKREFLEQVRELYREIRGPNVRHLSTENRTPEETEADILKVLEEMGY